MISVEKEKGEKKSKGKRAHWKLCCGVDSRQTGCLRVSARMRLFHGTSLIGEVDFVTWERDRMGSRPSKRTKTFSVSSQCPGQAVACCWHIPGLFHTIPFPVPHEEQAQQTQSGHDAAFTPQAIIHTKTGFPLGY